MPHPYGEDEDNDGSENALLACTTWACHRWRLGPDRVIQHSEPSQHAGPAIAHGTDTHPDARHICHGASCSGRWASVACSHASPTHLRRVTVTQSGRGARWSPGYSMYSCCACGWVTTDPPVTATEYVAWSLWCGHCGDVLRDVTRYRPIPIPPPHPWLGDLLPILLPLPPSASPKVRVARSPDQPGST